jgi:hypothetical protein
MAEPTRAELLQTLEECRSVLSEMIGADILTPETGDLYESANTAEQHARSIIDRSGGLR